MKNVGNKNVEFIKNESTMLKGIAILFMVCLHLFNRSNTNGYYDAWINIGSVPLIYYVSFIFDACVPIYCFCSGYGLYLKNAVSIKKNIKRIWKLLVNYWIVVILTCLVGIVLNHETIPGNLIDFLGTVFLFDIHYVGAWWFLQTYCLLVLTAPLLIKLTKKINGLIVLLISLIVYCVSYYFRMMNPIEGSYIAGVLVLYGTSLFSFVIGMLFYKYHVITTIRTKLGFNNLIVLLLFVSAVMLHIVVKSMILAPFTAILVIISFSLMKKSRTVSNFLLFWGKHSTNIWLVHMQFYMIFFKDIVFCTNTVIGALVICLGLCLITSYFINYLLQFAKKKVVNNL